METTRFVASPLDAETRKQQDHELADMSAQNHDCGMAGAACRNCKGRECVPAESSDLLNCSHAANGK